MKLNFTLFNKIAHKFWDSTEGVSQVANAVGKLLHPDTNTKELQRVNFARISVEVDPWKPFLDDFDIVIEEQDNASYSKSITQINKSDFVRDFVGDVLDVDYEFVAKKCIVMSQIDDHLLLLQHCSYQGNIRGLNCSVKQMNLRGVVKKETTVYFSLALLATFVLLSTATVTATAAPSTVTPRPKISVNPFCGTAVNKRVCRRMTNGARTWPEAMTNVIKAAIEKAKTGKPIAYGVGPKLPHQLLPETKESIASTCSEAYETMIYYLEQCPGLVKDDPTSALKTTLSSVSFFDCKYALEEFQVSLPEVNQFYQELLDLSDNLLSVLEKKP
ncbi:hypothetical protein Pfo_009360 [Paulownia fortunei]|nr:hypothetical protein Pfo_009360 [Paulownia fortunei]